MRAVSNGPLLECAEEVDDRIMKVEGGVLCKLCIDEPIASAAMVTGGWASQKGKLLLAETTVTGRGQITVAQTSWSHMWYLTHRPPSCLTEFLHGAVRVERHAFRGNQSCRSSGPDTSQPWGAETTAATATTATRPHLIHDHLLSSLDVVAGLPKRQLPS